MAAVCAAFASSQLGRPAGQRLPIRLACRTFTSSSLLRAEDGKKSKDNEGSSLQSAIAQSASSSRPAISHGSLASDSIFNQEEEFNVRFKNDGPAPKVKGGGVDEADIQRIPLEERNMDNLDRTLDPRPQARTRWLRKMVIRDVRRRGRLSKQEQILRTERDLLTKSHWFKTSLKKLGPLARQIAGKNVDDAILEMRFSPKKAAKDVKSFLEYAKNEAVVSRGMGFENLRQQGRQEQLKELKLPLNKKRQEVQDSRKLLQLLEEQINLKQQVLDVELELEKLPFQKFPGQQEGQEHSEEAIEQLRGGKEKELNEKVALRTKKVQEQQERIGRYEGQLEIAEEKADADADAEDAGEGLRQLRVKTHKVREKINSHEQEISEHEEQVQQLLQEIEAAKPQPVDITLKDGKSLKITDPSSMYIAQAWVNRGPYGMEPDYRARGQAYMLRPPHTGLSLILKEEKTRIREWRERTEKEAKRRKSKVWVQLPDRKIYGQSQYYSW